MDGRRRGHGGPQQAEHRTLGGHGEEGRFYSLADGSHGSSKQERDISDVFIVHSICGMEMGPLAAGEARRAGGAESGIQVGGSRT